MLDVNIDSIKAKISDIEGRFESVKANFIEDAIAEIQDRKSRE